MPSFTATKLPNDICYLVLASNVAHVGQERAVFNSLHLAYDAAHALEMMGANPIGIYICSKLNYTVSRGMLLAASEKTA